MYRFLTSFAVFFALSSIFLGNQAPALDTGDLVCETTSTTGTGTINLGGAVTNYVTFVSQITSGETVPYHIVSGDGKLEAGFGVFTDATPDTLTRVATWSTDGSGAELTLSGTSTVCLGPVASMFSGVTSQVLTSGTGATYTPPARAVYFKVICTGGGGGGGGSDTDGSGAAGAGGGQGGGTAIAWFDSTEMGANAVYTIGALGGGGADTGGSGTNGSDTTFNPAGTGATLTGAGGEAGTGVNSTDDSSVTGNGGRQLGTATNGDINLIGGHGGQGISGIEGTTQVPFALSGYGGASYWGGGPRPRAASGTSSTSAGLAGTVYGSGGGGAQTLDNTTGSAGGDGVAGICVVEEYGP